MANYQIAYKAITKEVVLQTQGDALPAGFVSIGTFVHDDNADTLGKPLAENHVLWHHVRDALYKQGQLDMQVVKITLDAVVNVISVNAGNDFSIAVAATQQLAPVVLPANTVNKSVTYSSATPAVATVSAGGLVTGVSAGTSVITVTTVDGAKTDTVTVTVT